MKCPNCGAKFILKDNIYQCKYCGYVEKIEKEDNELIDIETKFQNKNYNENDEEENDEEVNYEEEYNENKNNKIKRVSKKRNIKNTNYNGAKTKYDNNKKIEIGDNLTFLLFLGFMLLVYIISYFVGEGY